VFGIKGLAGRIKGVLRVGVGVFIMGQRRGSVAAPCRLGWGKQKFAANVPIVYSCERQREERTFTR
jgi:hypothetical protein